MSNEHRRGFAITLTGVLILCPDTLLMRLVDTDVWTLLFWRGLFMGIALLALYAAAEGPGWWSRLRALGLPGVATACIFAFNTTCFVFSIGHTAVANTLVIIATGPLIAAVLSWIFLRERIKTRTWAAMLATAAGMGFIFSGALAGDGLLGDLAAAGSAIGLATTFVIVRHFRHVNMVPTMALGGLLSAAFALLFAAPFSVAPNEFGWVLLMGLGVVPISFGLIALGPRYLPAPEVSLLMLLETIFGPLLVWAVVREMPSLETLLGGLIIVVALALHSLAALRRPKPVATVRAVSPQSLVRPAGSARATMAGADRV